MNFNFNDLSNFWMLGILFMIILAFIVFADANSNGENGTMWFFIVLLMPMMGFFFYLIMRSINGNQSNTNPSNSNYSNSVATSPPILETVRTKQSIPEIETKKIKSNNKNQSEYQFCTNCGFQNTLEASFCKSCGIKLLEDDL